MPNFDGNKFLTVIVAGGLALAVVTAEIAPIAFYEHHINHLYDHTHSEQTQVTYVGSQFGPAAISTSGDAVTFVSF